MLIVTVREGWSILKGAKVSTLRPLRANGKGYLTVGSIQQIRTSRNFKEPYLCKVLIYKRTFINIEDLQEEDFRAFGYPDRASYMAQPYNQRNPSPERVRYDFVALPELLNMLECPEWTPILFASIWRFVKLNPELSEGVESDLIYEGCDPSDLEDALLTIQGNIMGLL